MSFIVASQISAIMMHVCISIATSIVLMLTCRPVISASLSSLGFVFTANQLCIVLALVCMFMSNWCIFNNMHYNLCESIATSFLNTVTKTVVMEFLELMEYAQCFSFYVAVACFHIDRHLHTKAFDLYMALSGGVSPGQVIPFLTFNNPASRPTPDALVS